MTRQPTKSAVDRARHGALEWLTAEQDGYPRSWAQEDQDDRRRGYQMYEDDWEAPPIAGYEALEREGLAVRAETVVHQGCERIHFKLIVTQQEMPK